MMPNKEEKRRHMRYCKWKKNISIGIVIVILLSMVPMQGSEAAVNGPIDPGWVLTENGFINNEGGVIPGAIARGVDVSVFQGPINWNTVAAEGITFAFVRFGSTLKGMDTRFKENMKGAAAAGIRTGVYVYSYATTPEEAAAEAYMVLSNIGDCTVSFPIVIDLESDIQKGLSKETLTNIANTFCMVIENAGYYPMVYASKNWFATRMNSIAYDKWVAHYNTSCGDSEKAIWQATSYGGVAGISGRVDINFLFKDYSSSIISDGFLVRKDNTYFYKNWKMQTGWVDFNGGRYYMDATGRMQTGWVADGSGVYFLYDTGAMAIGLIQIGDFWYYFNEKGQMQTGAVTINGSQYLFDAEGKMQVGFIFDGTYLYYYSNGGMTVGAVEIEGDSYYFDKKGHMQTGWVKHDGATYLYGPDGKMQLGWVSDGTYAYYMNPSLTVGAVEIEGAGYHFDKNGHMQTGFIKEGGYTFLYGPDGTMQKGWVSDGVNQYYFMDGGAMTIGWLAIEDQSYYFDKNGHMQIGLIKNGNITYYTDAAGAMVRESIVQIGDSYSYFGADGSMVKDAWIQIENELYYFNKNGTLGEVKQVE